MTGMAPPSLPEDCIFEVLQYLSAEDLARVSSTCSVWHRLSGKNSLWQRLCLERWRTWPSPRPFSSFYDSPDRHNNQHDHLLYGMLDGMTLGSKRAGSSTSPPETLPDLHGPEQWYSTPLPPYEMDTWKKVYQERHEKDAIVRMLLEEMLEDSRNRMRHMDGIAGIGMVHARDVLDNIIAGRNGEERDLTRTYYARKTLKRLRRGWVLDQWRAYRSNSQSFPIWQGCALMTMFSNHEMELSDIDRQFQDLADEFLEESPLPESEYGSSSASPTFVIPGKFDRYSPDSFSTSPDRRQGRSRAEYSRHYESQVERLKHLIQFFTQDKGFKGNTENYYDPFNSFIDKVLARKVGIPISLSIVFAELAQRVGLVGVELIGFPQHFMVRFRPPVPVFDPPSSLQGSPNVTPPSPPTYYLDLFHPPHRLLSTEDYEGYFATLSIPQPPNIYRDLPTPPLEIFLRCLRNIILAVNQIGGAGRIGSDHQTSLYSSLTQLLALHPSEEWELYVLWLKYLSNFWPEDVGFVRTSIEDVELKDHRRMTARGHSSSASPPHNQQRPRHVLAHRQGRFHDVGAGPAAHFASSTHETIKIMRAQVRELELADEAGDVGQIRRRRRPKVTHARRSIDSGVKESREEMQGSSTTASPTASSPTIDDQASNATHYYDRQSSISGEQQNESRMSIGAHLHEQATTRLGRVAAFFGGEERRRPEPEYYVGEVFRHLIYRYTGAIYGYDLKCEAQESWIQAMGVDSLVHGRHQPFYNALLSDGSRRYVAQENIQVLFRDYRRVPLSSSFVGDDALADQIQSATAVPSAPSRTPAELPLLAGSTPFTLQFSELGPLGIETVGQYFEAWDGQHGHYVMNKEIRKLYPTEDYL